MRPLFLSLIALLSLALSSPPARASEPPTPPGLSQFLKCDGMPPNRVLKLNLKPEVALKDLARFMSSVSCSVFTVSEDVSVDQKLKLTAPANRLTLEQTYDMFMAALDSGALTVQPEGRVLRIVRRPAR